MYYTCWAVLQPPRKKIKNSRKNLIFFGNILIKICLSRKITKYFLFCFLRLIAIGLTFTECYRPSTRDLSLSNPDSLTTNSEFKKNWKFANENLMPIFFKMVSIDREWKIIRSIVSVFYNGLASPSNSIIFKNPTSFKSSLLN